MAASHQSAFILTWSSRVCVFSTRTLVIGFRAHLDNPEYSHLKIFNLITSLTTVFPNKVIHRFQAYVSFGGEEATIQLTTKSY